MKSIYDLIRDKSQLSSVNQGMSNLKYDQISSLRNIIDSDVNNSKFGSGLISFRWNYGGSWWLPSRSYFRIDCELSKTDGSPLEEDDNIAINMNPASCLFSKLEFKIEDKTISQISENLSQIDSLKTRQNRTASWMNTIGSNLNFWQSSFKERQQQVIRNGYIKEELGNKSYVEIKSKTELGFADNATLAIAVTNILTFVNADDLTSLFRSGDILVVKVNGEAFKRAFWVISVINDTTLQLADFGTTLNPAIVAAAGANLWWRYRYSLAELLSEKEIDQEGAAALIVDPAKLGSLLTFLVTNLEKLNQGDVFMLAGNVAPTRYHGDIFHKRISYLTGNIASFITPTDVATNAGNVYKALRYKHGEFIDTLDFGYLQSTVNVTGHAVNLALADADGKQILTITKLGDVSEIPDVKNHFQVGDIIVYKLTAVNTYRQGLIIEVDPSANGRSLSIIGTNTSVAQGDAGDATNHLIRLLRPNNRLSNFNKNKARKLRKFSVFWQPPLSIFSVSSALPACGKFEIDLSPFSNQVYQKNVIESILADKLHGTDYNFLIKNMLLYNLKVDGPIIQNDEFYLDLNEIRMQGTTLTTHNRTQSSLDVSPSTYKISLAFQDSAVETDTRYSQTKFKIRNEEELNLENMYILYSQQQKPVPDLRPIYDVNNFEESLMEIYARNIFYNGDYFETSKESIDEWLERGIYISYPWPKEGSNRETRLYVSTQFSEAFSSEPRLILFNHYKKICIVKIQNNRVQEVIINEV